MELGFMELWSQMGLLAKSVVVILLLQSVWSIGVMIERFLMYRASRKQSEEFVPEVAEALKNDNIQGAIDLAEEKNKSHLAKVLVAGLKEFQAHEESDRIPGEKVEASRRALQRATAVGIEEFKRGLGGLATIWKYRSFCGPFRHHRWHHQRFRRHEPGRRYGFGRGSRGNLRGPGRHRIRSVRRDPRCVDVQLLHRQDRVLCGRDG